MKTPSRLILLGFALFATTGCGNSLACESTLESADGVYVGIDSSAEQSRRNACNKYCLEEDLNCDGIYQIWRDAHPTGTADKMSAMYEEPALLDCVTITCADDCIAAANSGDIALATTCAQ